MAGESSATPDRDPNVYYPSVYYPGLATVTFDAQGNKVSLLDKQGKVISIKAIYCNKWDQLGDAIPIARRAGYTFKGWTLTQEDDGNYINELTGFYKDTTVFAQWEKGRYPFRMYGNIVEIYRYKADTVNLMAGGSSATGPSDETGALEKLWAPELLEENGNYFRNKEEADFFAQQESGTVTELDTTRYQWIDGVEVDDVPDTYAEAIQVYEMGKKEYTERKTAQTQEEYLLDLEARVSKIELGII